MESPRAVVEAFGGAVRLAELCSVNRTAVSNWMREGFPKSRIPDLLRLAELHNANGITLSLLMTMTARYPARQRSAKEAA